MKRLFIGFYLAVLLILLGAWLIQAYLFSRAFKDAGQPFEDAFAGGLRAARSIYEASPSDPDGALQSLQELYEHPIRRGSVADLPAEAQDRFAAGNDVAIFHQEGLNFAIPLTDASQALVVGPIRTPRGPSQSEYVVSMGALLLLVAVAIAALLRPISNQLRRLEEAATAIAGGNFSARVEERKVPSAKTLAIALNDMASRTESLLNAQREMLQAVSHELRTPLARIGFAIDLLREEVGEEQRAKRLDSLEAAAQEMDRLVSELLHYIRWESGPPPTNDESVELASSIENAVDKHQALYPAKCIAIGAGVPREAAMIRCDRRGLERILGNVIGNALRHADRQVSINCSRDSAEFLIDVDDDGPGVPASDRDRIFEPFVRLDDSGRGAGLGLALVRRILRHFGGSACALQSPAGGCRLRISIPLDRLEAAQ